MGRGQDVINSPPKNYLAPNVCSAELETCWELMNPESFARERMNSLKSAGGRKYGLHHQPNAILLPHERQ